MKPTCTAAYTVTRYVVTTYNEDPSQHEFRWQAERAAEAAARRNGYAELLKVRGEPVTDLWERPEFLGSYERSEQAAA